MPHDASDSCSSAGGLPVAPAACSGGSGGKSGAGGRGGAGAPRRAALERVPERRRRRHDRRRRCEAALPAAPRFRRVAQPRHHDDLEPGNPRRHAAQHGARRRRAAGAHDGLREPEAGRRSQRRAIELRRAGQVVKLAAGTYTVSVDGHADQGRRAARRRARKGRPSGGTTIVQDRRRVGAGHRHGQDQACYNSAFGTAVRADRRRREGDDDGHRRLGRRQLRGGRPRAHRSGRRRDGAGGRLHVLQARRQAIGRASASRSPRSTRGAGTLTLEHAAALDLQGRRQLRRADRQADRQPSSAGPASRAWRSRAGRNPGYDGQMAGGIDISNAAYCWVKDVQTDGTIARHARDADRDLPHASCATATSTTRRNYGFGTDCYGIVLRCGAADNLDREQHRPLHEQADPVQRLGRRQRHRLQLRRQLLGDAARLAGGQHRHATARSRTWS